jgi:hypothetical protein
MLGYMQRPHLLRNFTSLVEALETNDGSRIFDSSESYNHSFISNDPSHFRFLTTYLTVPKEDSVRRAFLPESTVVRARHYNLYCDVLHSLSS